MSTNKVLPSVAKGTDKIVFEHVQPFKLEGNCPDDGCHEVFQSPKYYCKCEGNLIERLDFYFHFLDPKELNPAIRIQPSYWIGSYNTLADGTVEEVTLQRDDFEVLCLKGGGKPEVGGGLLDPPVKADKFTMISVTLAVQCSGPNNPNLDGVQCMHKLVLWHALVGPKIEVVRLLETKTTAPAN